jgi:DNA-binding HxlR family transcriptional regulator
VVAAPIRDWQELSRLLVQLDDIEFKALRGAIELSDSALSKQLSLLESIGYVTMKKGYVGKRPRT